MKVTSIAPAQSASVTSPELGATRNSTGTASRLASAVPSATVTPRGCPIASRVTKKADMAGAATTPTRSFPDEASSLVMVVSSMGRRTAAVARAIIITISASLRKPFRGPALRWTGVPISRNVARPAGAGLFQGKPVSNREPSGGRRCPENAAWETSDMPIPRASKALSRFTVLDLTRVRSGPTCVRQLADWGANVIKIESPPQLESGEPPGGPREGSDFQNLHRNKRSITLNLKAPEGLAVFRRLVKKADVVVENFRPDVKKRLGIDYKDLRKINPRIVYGSISGFGQSGPYATRPGFDQIAQGMGGLMSITGLPGQGPVRVGIPIADLTAGLFCAMGILTALLEREKSGKGQHIETSLLQAQIFMLDFQAARYLVKGEVAKQAGNNHPTSIPTGVFKTADGHINIASTGQKIWERFCKAIEAPDMMANPDYANGASRSKNRDALNAEIDRHTVKRSSAEGIDRLNQAGGPGGPIHLVDQKFADPQVKHVRMAQPVKKSKLTLVGQPFTLSRTPSKLDAPPPELGQHTGVVLKQLGYSAKQIAALRKANAI